MKPALAMAQEAAEALAIQALTYIAGDGERLGRFLAATGIGPAEIRRAATRARVSCWACSTTSPATSACSPALPHEAGFDPADVGKAPPGAERRQWEREIP